MNYKIFFLFVMLVCFATIPGFTQNQADDNPPTPYALVITGNELLKGVYADSHTQFITSTLAPLGCRCVASLSVGDSEQDLIDALNYASEHGEFIIVTGGLGPTPADITRQTVSKFTGIPIEIDDELLDRMANRFRTPKDKLRENLVRQTFMPTKGTHLKNTVGSAYGPVFDDDGHVIICLPGPPRELQAMVKNELVHFLADRFGIRRIGASLQMRFVGIGESNIDETIQKKMSIPKDLMMEFKFDLGRVDVTLSMPHDTDEDKQTLKKFEEELLSHIKEFFYADDGSTLEENVLHLLYERSETIAVAEVGSGGAIAASLGDSPNSDGVYLGGFVAPKHENLLKLVNQDQSLSHEINEESTIELAKRICRMIGSNWGIAVSEAVEDGDNRYVWVAMGSEKEGFQTDRMGIGRGNSAQKRLVTNVINSLRKRIN